MPSPMTDTMDIHYEQYKEYFEGNERVYVKIIKEILISKGERRRQFKKIFTLARKEFLSTKTPNYLGLFNGSSGYVEDSIKSQRSRLKRLGVVDAEGLFTELFFNEYVRRYDKIRDKKKRLDAIKKDSGLFEDYSIHTVSALLGSLEKKAVIYFKGKGYKIVETNFTRNLMKL